MTIQLIFHVDMQSSYHVGAGQRMGPTVDAALLRDHDGAPILRGSALAGLLREGFRELVEIVPGDLALTQKDWQDSAETNLFGYAAHPKRWCYSSARPFEPVQGDAFGNWGADNVTRVRVNPRTRRVAPNKLFVQEEGDDRLRFQFVATCYGGDERDRADALLLIAAAQMVRHLGAARRRGRGHCRIHLVSASGLGKLDLVDEDLADAALDAFKQQWLIAQTLPDHRTQMEKPMQPPSGEQMRLRIAARAVEPVIVSKRSEVGNAFETLDVILGTAVLGALAQRAARTTGMRGDASAEFVHFFQHGGVRVTNLQPATFMDERKADLIPTIAAPKSLLQCENVPGFRPNVVDPHPHYDTLSDNLPPDSKCAECGGKLEPVTGYLTVAEYSETHTVKPREEPHIRVDDEKQRVNERDGGLFEYMAMEAGQWFVGELQCDAAHWPRIQTLTGLKAGERSTLRVGKGTRRGYGLLHLVLEAADETPQTAIVRPFSKRVAESLSGLSLLLLSDAIVADRWGRFYTGFDAKWLTRLLDIEGVSVTVEGQSCNSRLVHSFNTYRRMPRYRDTAIEAGSVCRMSFTGVTRDNREQVVAKLKQWEQEGIGWRRHEGFGRIALNHPIFAPDDDLDDSLFIHTTITKLSPHNEDHPLQSAERFRQEWQETLEKNKWGRIKAEYDALARLIYLHRKRPLVELLAWLDSDVLGKPQRLWGNVEAFPARDLKGRIEKAFLQALHKTLKTELDDVGTAKREIALTMTADHIAAEATKARQEQQEA